MLPAQAAPTDSQPIKKSQTQLVRLKKKICSKTYCFSVFIKVIDLFQVKLANRITRKHHLKWVFFEPFLPKII